MSRKIDITKKLSEEDRQYLLDRNQYNLLDQNEAIMAGADFDKKQGPDASIVTSTDPEQDYDKMKVDELRALAVDRELSDEGLKPELVARLKDYDATRAVS